MKKLIVNSKIYKGDSNSTIRMFPGDLKRSPDDFILGFVIKFKSKRD